MAEIIVDIGDNLVETIGCEFKGKLVRCKECRHWAYGKDICTLHDMGMVADDFCSYGERKADD